MKTYQALFVAAISIVTSLSANQVLAAEACEVQNFHSGLVRTVQFADRRVWLVGWQHPSGAIFSTLATTISKEFLNTDCTSMAASVNSVASKYATSALQNEIIVSNLASIDRESPLTTLGTEFSQKQFQQIRLNMAKAYKAAEIMKERCPSPDVQQSLDKIARIYSGPGEVYVRDNKTNAVLVGVEADELLNKSNEIARRESTLAFKIAETPKAFREAFLKLSLEGSLITETEAASLNSMLTAEQRAHASAYYDYANELDRSTFVRNEFIKDQILQTRGNYALVIGAAHVADLTKRMQKACLEGAR